MAAVDLKGAKVVHKAFGEGVVISHVHRTNSKDALQIDFSGIVEEVVYPDAFEQALSVTDPKIRTAIAADLETLAEKKREEKERQLEKWKTTIKPLTSTQDMINREDIRLTAERIKDERNGLRKNIVFKCNYTDGGRSLFQIGFDGICSDRMIKNNIVNEKRTWCTQDSCACFRYNKGEINRSELDNKFGKEFICYECSMLRDWKVMSGMYANGKRKGQAIKPLHTDRHSLAILTTRYPGESESDRVVFAVFLIEDFDRGTIKEDACIKSGAKYRLAFSPIECRKLLFWKYYSNIGDSSRPVWASGLFRYLSDYEAVQLLRDIVEVKKNTKDASLAKSFLNHFCKLHEIDEKNVPEPKGALML